MGNLNLLTGFRILEEVDSPINGKIRVVKDLAFGTHIQVENLTQSGGVVYEVWRSTLKKLKTQNPNVKTCLILGLGGGSAAKVIRKFWPNAKIIGIDVDLFMVEMGRKYLGLDKLEIEIKIEDALKFCRRQIVKNTKYDLIIVDLYVGCEVPEKFKKDSFLKLVRSLLTKEGTAVFNRLYFGEKRPDSMQFGKKLEKIFSKVDYVFPEANLMFVCSK